MNIFGLFNRVTKQPILNRPSSMFPVGGLISPERNTTGYLEAYNSIGWWHAVVFRIALGMSEVKWTLNNVSDKKKPKQIDNHKVLDLLHNINPFQTSNEFIALDTIYMESIGESFWILNYNGNNEPAEIVLPYPNKMSVVPAKEFPYVKGYVYGSGAEAIPFDVKDVIHFKYPNPLNQYRGLGQAQTIGTNLDAMENADKWVNQFFYNSARPDGVIEFDYNLTDQQFEALKLQWLNKYQGVSKAHQVALLEGGGKYKQIQNTVKDMDFPNLNLKTRDVILGVEGMPLSVMGISENVNKANAEAGDYTFARWIVKPRLDWKVAKLNEQLLPKFNKSDNLELGYEEVVPETIEQKMQLAESGIRAGYLTINEARKLRGLDALPNADVFLIPMNLLPTPIDRPMEPPPQPEPAPQEETPEDEKPVEPKKSKTFESDSQKDSYWTDYVSRAESYEAHTISLLREMYLKQKVQALDNLRASNNNLLDMKKARKDYIKIITPILTQVMYSAIKNGRELFEPPNPHKQIEPLLSTAAMRWLKSRIGWAADQIGEESASRLSQIVSEGYASGESMDQIARHIEDEFDYFSNVRSERIARTEIMQASAQGAIEGYKEAGVTKVEFYTALDERTCEDCNSMHGQEFTLEDSVGIITVHPNCRCVFLPIVD